MDNGVHTPTTRPRVAGRLARQSQMPSALRIPLRSMTLGKDEQ